MTTCSSRFTNTFRSFQKYPLSDGVERKFSSLLTDIYAIQNQFPYSDFAELDALILSCPFSASSQFSNTRRSALVEKFFKARNVLFTTSEERLNLLFVGLLKSGFSSKDIEKIQLSLISDTRNKTSNLSLDFMNNCFRIQKSNFGKNFALENELLETAVNGWIWVGKESMKRGKAIHRRVKSFISFMLTHSLMNENVKAACVLSLIEKHPESLVLDICLDFSTEDKDLIVTEREFLNTLLRSDSFRFVGPMLSCFEEMGPRMLSLWESGYLDDSFEILLRQVQSSSGTSKFLSEIVASQTSKRLLAHLSSTKMVDIDEITSLLNLMITIFDTTTTTAIDNHSIAAATANFFSLFSSGQYAQRYGEGTTSLCSFGMCILDHLKRAGQDSDNQAKTLVSELFSFLFTTLPLITKKNSSRRPTKIKSDLVLEWLIRIMEENSNHLDLSKIEPSMIQKVCRVCLKHGIAVGNDEQKVPLLSLHFMGLLMELMTKNDYNSPTVPTCRDVFDMIVSHSKFEQLFTNTNESEKDTATTGEKTKQHVLRLMITCAMLSTENIEITSDVWKIIFASFNAGMMCTDALIRHLFSSNCIESLPFMDELHWKGCVMDNREQTSSGKLDWLVDALDQARVRASVSRFPVADKMEQSISFHDVWTEKMLHENQAVFDRESDDAEQYSPSFLLPLILKHIESGLSRTKEVLHDETQMSDEENQEPKLGFNFSKSSTDSIQQLCEKGVVSLCLASLSSLCEKVRCYAVSILGLILQACLSNYAIDSPSWRDRPQLVMILNAVQRALVLQMALDEDESVVPRVTSVVATFLARAASVLPRPDDALYVSMNRYFLKTEANHGAFQDLKRLPAFMSLFCSSSEDPNQSRAERMWGLQILCDGLTDASCYKLVTACHAPELILSSFENVRLSKASDEAKGAEICLLLGSLTSMIKYGEYGAHIHLIRRCGLLSWMSSVCSTRSIATAFPTERSRISFCQLGNEVVEKVLCTPQLRSSELIDEVCALIQPIVSLCSIKGESREHSRGVYQASFATLATIANGLRNLREENIFCPDILPLGVPIESSLNLLRITDDSMKAQALRTLCSLPFSLAANLQQDIGKELIVLMIDYFNDVLADDQSSTNTDSEEELIAIVLQRVFLLIEQCEIVLPSPKKSMSSEIVTKLFALRCHQKFSDMNVRKLWLQSLKLLTQKVHTGGLEIKSLEETIRREICS